MQVLPVREDDFVFSTISPSFIQSRFWVQLSSPATTDAGHEFRIAGDHQSHTYSSSVQCNNTEFEKSNCQWFVEWSWGFLQYPCSKEKHETARFWMKQNLHHFRTKINENPMKRFQHFWKSRKLHDFTDFLKFPGIFTFPLRFSL